MLRRLRILPVLLLLTVTAFAQPYSLLIKNGYLPDQKDTLDIAIRAGNIAAIAKHIDPRTAKKTIDAKGLIVCPGLIDIHTHVFFGTDPDKEYAGGTEGLHPDSFSFRAGVTTIVDAGSSGWRNFETFKKRVIDHSQTRVLAFLNIVGAGMRGGHYEQDTMDMNAEPTAATALRFKDYIVGIKVAHYTGASWHPVDAAVKAGTMANIPVMVDFGGHNPPLSIQQLFQTHLRPKDIFTHCFAQLTDRQPIVDPVTGTLKPFVKEARQNGIVFDVGYGEISFVFSQALPAIKSGFLPNSLSSDIHTGPTHDLLDIMSQFLAMGVDLSTVIRMASRNPADEIGRQELGRLQQGAPGDIAILYDHPGRYQFIDHKGQKITGAQKLECLYTIKAGKIVYCRKTPCF